MGILRLCRSGRWWAGVAALACAVAAAPQGSPAQESSLAIVGATLIDGTGAAPQRDVVVLIEGNRISRIGPRGATSVPPGARVIDAAGKFVIPGLIDSHVHYRDYYSELFATHGITAVADWGGSPADWVLAQKDAIAAGRALGPRIYTCGEMIEVDLDPAGAVKAADELADRGVSLIAFGFGAKLEGLRAAAAEAHRRGLRAVGYPIDVRQAIEAGLDTIKHTYTVGAANILDPARRAEIQRQLEIPERQRDARLFLLDDDYDAALRLLLDHHVTWVPTFVKDFKVIHDRRDEFERESLALALDPDLAYLPLDTYLPQLPNVHQPGLAVVASGLVGTVDREGPDYERYRRAHRAVQGLIRTLVQKGGRVLAGTAPHSFVLPGLALHQELQLFVDAGLTPMQALQASTLRAAEWLRADKDIGSIEVGKLGDLVVLGRDPLADIHNTRSVEVVVQGGRVLPLGYHRHYTNPIPRSTSRNAPGAGSPRPQLDAVEPATAVEGRTDLVVTLKGRAFMPGAVVLVDGVPVETRYVSSGEVSAHVPAGALQRIGTYWLVVSNPRPGGGESAPSPLIVKVN